jgi:hypothetical protein
MSMLILEVKRRGKIILDTNKRHMHVYYTPKTRITGPKICVWASSSSSISSLFSKTWMTRQTRKKKKETVVLFAALVASILPVETQWGAYGILQKNVESVGAHGQKLGKKLANSTILISLEFCIITLTLPVRYY